MNSSVERSKETEGNAKTNFLPELLRIVKKNIAALRNDISDLVQRNLTGKVNVAPPFEEDVILPQERFENPEWCKDLATQIKKLKEIHPNLQVDPEYFAKREKDISPENTKRVIIPKLAFLAKENGIDNPYDDIGVLVEQVCAQLDIQREGKFTHYRKGQLGQDRIKIIPQIAEQRKKLEASVPGDALILDVDMGNTYAGWTPRRARAQSIIEADQIALSSVDVGWILTLNPNRLEKNTDLSIDSVMEEYLSLDRGWVTVLFFYYRGGKLEFGYRWNRRQYFDCGAAIAKLR